MALRQLTALCASDTRLARIETECRPTTQMENQTSYMVGYLLFGVLVKLKGISILCIY